MERSPWEADCSSASQEFSKNIRNPVVFQIALHWPLILSAVHIALFHNYGLIALLSTSHASKSSRQDKGIWNGSQQILRIWFPNYLLSLNDCVLFRSCNVIQKAAHLKKELSFLYIPIYQV
jgi:hypothetical protein